MHRSQQGHEDDDGDCVHRKRQLPTGTGNRNKREIVVFQLISPKKIATAEASSRLRVGAALKHGVRCVLIKSCLPILHPSRFPLPWCILGERGKYKITVWKQDPPDGFLRELCDHVQCTRFYLVAGRIDNNMRWRLWHRFCGRLHGRR